MTDVIGSAEIDGVPRRRLRARHPRLLWLAAALVVAAVIVVPGERRHLADVSGRWVQAQWTQRAAYDDARAAVIEEVSRRAGVLDQGIVEEAARTADGEEAAAIAAVGHRLSARRTWAPDVSSGRDAAVAAIRLETHALLRDATAAHPTLGYLFEPSVERLIAVASRRVTAMARRRHLGAAPVARVQLQPARAALARLQPTTDVATGLSLVLAGEGMPRVLDLDTGAQRQIRRSRGSGVGFWSGRLLILNRLSVDMLDAHGRRLATLDAPSPEIVATGDGSLWLSSVRGVRRFDARGRPSTRWVRLPADRAPAAAADDVVVLVDDTGHDPQIAEAWDPISRTVRPLPSSCSGEWAAARQTIVALPCAGDDTVTTIDARTWAVHRLPLPGHVADTSAEMLNALSPDGRRLAVVLGNDDPRVVVLDLRAGRLARSPLDPSVPPVGWSPDGQWLLLADTVSFGGSRHPRVALWRPRDGAQTSVRPSADAQLADGAQLLALLNE